MTVHTRVRGPLIVLANARLIRSTLVLCTFSLFDTFSSSKKKVMWGRKECLLEYYLFKLQTKLIAKATY